MYFNLATELKTIIELSLEKWSEGGVNLLFQFQCCEFSFYSNLQYLSRTKQRVYEGARTEITYIPSGSAADS